MKKLMTTLCVMSCAVFTSAFANDNSQPQPEGKSQVIECHGKLQELPDGYLLFTQISGIQLMVNIGKQSAQKFGQCSEGDFLIDLNSKDEDGGVKLLDMNCQKK